MSDQDNLRDRIADLLWRTDGMSWEDQAQAIIDEFGLTDRFIAKVRADALREAAEAWRKHLLTTDASYVCAESWLTVRAGRIEEEA